LIFFIMVNCMLVICDKCQAKYKIKIKKKPGKAVKFKCGKCSNLIRIEPEQISSEAEKISAPEPENKAPPAAKAETVKVSCLKCGNSFIKPKTEKSPICYQCRIDSLVSKIKDKYGVATVKPTQEQDVSRYTVRSADGLVLGPIKLHTVSVLARENKIKGNEEVSKDDAEYKPLMSFPELAELFPHMKEIMDTDGLDDKVDEAFMSAFGGEDREDETAAPAEPEPEGAPEAEAAAEPAEEELPSAPEAEASETESEAAAPPEDKIEEPEIPVEPETDRPPAEAEPEPEATAEATETEEAAVEETQDMGTEVSAPIEGEPEPEERAGPEDREAESEEDEVIDWGREKKEIELSEQGPPIEEPEDVPAAREGEEELAALGDADEAGQEIEAPEPPAEMESEAGREAAPAGEEESAEAVPEPDTESGTEFDIGEEWETETKTEKEEEEEEKEEEEEEIIEDLVPITEPPPDARYRIRYPDGLMLGPVKLDTIQELFDTGNLTGQEEVQREEEPWVGFAELPELAELVTEADVIGEDDVIELTDVLEESG
jgi:predicted Zn finger-like uncharacterized protein